MKLEAKSIVKKYGKEHTALTVLNGIDLELTKGEFVGIYGASGSGKSTLLHILGGLDLPTSGNVLFNGEDIYKYNDEKRSDYRNRKIGFVFQFYHLLPEFSAEENVMVPCLIAGISKKEAKVKASKALEKTGLLERKAHKPSELSGGEQQRVAISRAIVMQPDLLLADEPTGNLDVQTGKEVMDVLMDLNKALGMGIVMVTHDHALVDKMDRRLDLKDGILRT